MEYRKLAEDFRKRIEVWMTAVSDEYTRWQVTCHVTWCLKWWSGNG